MGVAELSCGGGCNCTPAVTRINANDESERTSTTGEAPEVKVSQSEECELLLRLLEAKGDGENGGNKFKLLGVDIQLFYDGQLQRAVIGTTNWR